MLNSGAAFVVHLLSPVFPTKRTRSFVWFCSGVLSYVHVSASNVSPSRLVRVPFISHAFVILIRFVSHARLLQRTVYLY